MYNFAKLFYHNSRLLLCITLIFTANDEQKFASTANKTQQQSRDGFANETISREGFAGFVKPFTDSTNRLHKTQKSETGFG